MIIIINGENIDFSLEKEENLGDVISGISSWLEESGMLIESVRIDGERAPLAEGNWRERRIESIEELDVSAVSQREGRIIQLQTARDYFLLLEKALLDDDEDSLEELSNGYEDLLKILPRLLDEGPHPSLLPALDAAFDEAGFPLRKGRSITVTESLQHRVASVGAFLELRKEEIVDPEARVNSTAKALSEMAADLDDVAIQLQTGKDKSAMQTIIKLTELLGAFHRSLMWLKSDGEINKITEEFNGILTELEEALKANDTVLIGDLLEYELKPRLAELPSKMTIAEETVQ